MTTQNLVKLCGRPTLRASNNVKIDSPRATYVMQGSAGKKALDTYHLIFAPTHACNLRCKHCYLPDHARTLIPQDVAVRLVHEWSDIVLEERGQYGGIFHIKGGEPFIVPYLWELIDTIAELRSLQLMMTTNGTFLDSTIFERLGRYNYALDGHITMVVSLDGATEQTHAILRGKGQFAKTLRFLDGIRQQGITLHLNCVLHKGNINELSEYIDLAKGHRVTQVNFLSFVPRGIGSEFREFQVPHMEVYQHLDSLYENGDEETKMLLVGSLPHIRSRELSGRYRTSHECVAAYRGMFYITPDGRVNTCPNIVASEFSVGNIFGNGLREISDNLPNLYDRLKPYSQPYVCTGESLLYEKVLDSDNQKSLKMTVEQIGKGARDSSVGEVASVELSYCFSRNY